LGRQMGRGGGEETGKHQYLILFTTKVREEKKVKRRNEELGLKGGWGGG